MIFYSEPDEGTIMIWLDEIVEELKKYNFEYDDDNDDDKFDGADTKFLYFIDADCEEYNEIVEIVKRHNYKIFGWEVN